MKFEKLWLSEIRRCWKIIPDFPAARHSLLEFFLSKARFFDHCAKCLRDNWAIPELYVHQEEDQQAITHDR